MNLQLHRSSSSVDFRENIVNLHGMVRVSIPRYLPFLYSGVIHSQTGRFLSPGFTHRHHPQASFTDITHRRNKTVPVPRLHPCTSSPGITCKHHTQTSTTGQTRRFLFLGRHHPQTKQGGSYTQASPIYIIPRRHLQTSQTDQTDM